MAILDCAAPNLNVFKPFDHPVRMMSTRAASHAGSWYSASATTLSDELEEWLQVVGPSIEGVGKVPQPGARVIIAP